MPRTRSARDCGHPNGGNHNEQRGSEHDTCPCQVLGCAVVTLYLQFAASVAGKQSDRHVVQRVPVPRSPYDLEVLGHIMAARVVCPRHYERPDGIHNPPLLLQGSARLASHSLE